MKHLILLLLITVLLCLENKAQSSPGDVLIGEVITDPQVDWSTTGFNGQDGQGTISQGVDEWIELYIVKDGLDLNNWSISLLDGSDVTGDLTNAGAFQVTNYISTEGGSFSNTHTGDFLILGNVTGSSSMSNDIDIVLLNELGDTIDAVQIGSGNGGDPAFGTPSGNASSVVDEATARLPHAWDTDEDELNFCQLSSSMGMVNTPDTVFIEEDSVFLCIQQDSIDLSFFVAGQSGLWKTPLEETFDGLLIRSTHNAGRYSFIDTSSNCTVELHHIHIFNDSCKVLINEVVTDPQQDWSTHDFNGIIGEGAVTQGNDEWVELKINESGLSLSDWTISLLDGTDVIGSLTSGEETFQTVNYISNSGLTHADSTGQGDYLILGNIVGGGAMNNDVTIVLYDGFGEVIDSLSLGVNVPNGNAIGIIDESIARIPDGWRTKSMDDFCHITATMGFKNGFYLDLEQIVCKSASPKDLTDIFDTPFSGYWEGPEGIFSGIFDPQSGIPGVYSYVIDNEEDKCVNGKIEIDVVVPYAGEDISIMTCNVDSLFDLSNLVDTSGTEGWWLNASGDTINHIFNPSIDTSGLYRYQVYGIAQCSSDAEVFVDILLDTQRYAGSDTSFIFCESDMINLASHLPLQEGMWVDILGDSVQVNTLIFNNVQTDTTIVYYHIVESGGACLTDTMDVTLQVNKHGIAGEDNIITVSCDSTEVSLTGQLQGNPDKDGIWLAPNGVNHVDDIFIKGVDDIGVYTYLISREGCDTSSAFLTIQLDSCNTMITRNEDTEEITEMIYYTNPVADNTLYLKVNNHSIENAEISIHTLSGVEVYHGVVKNTQEQISIPLYNIKGGLYILKVTSKEGSYKNKIIIR